MRTSRRVAVQFSLPGVFESTEMPHGSFVKMSQRREEHGCFFGAVLFLAVRSGDITTCLEHNAVCGSFNDLMRAAGRPEQNAEISKREF